MQQHPIPQNVMSVEFQLIGDLTLRQFAYLAVGGMLVFLLFITPLNDIVKWGLILLVGGFFAGLAFVPINDISLDRWVVAFFRAINSPTKRIWRREIKELSFFARNYAEQLLGHAPTIVASDRNKLERYLATLKASQPQSELDLAEQAYLSSLPFEEGGPAPALANLLAPPPPAELPFAPAVAPEITIPVAPPIEEKRVVEEDLTKATPLQPNIKPVITVHMPHKNIYVRKVSTTTVNRQLHSLSSLEGTIVLPVRGEKTFELSPELKQRLYPEQLLEQVGEAGAAGPAMPTTPSEVLTAAPPAAPIPVVPTTEAPPSVAPTTPTKLGPIHIEKDENVTGAAMEELEKKLAAEAAVTRERLTEKRPYPSGGGAGQPGVSTTTEVPTVAGGVPAQPATTAPSQEQAAPLPKQAQGPEIGPKIGTKPAVITPLTREERPVNIVAPTPAIGKMAPPAANVPNVIVGLIRDGSGLLLTDVVVVVSDADGEPVRALKTNKVGQFAISTPLPNGRYTITLEKDDYLFDTIGVDLTGQIFQPIEIRAQGGDRG